jgi:hypothetical protein
LFPVKVKLVTLKLLETLVKFKGDVLGIIILIKSVLGANESVMVK